VRRVLTILLLLALLVSGRLPAAGSAEETPQPILRALLVTCDRFVSQPETTPAAQQNAMLMKSLLSSDAREYQEIRTECDTISSVEGFAQAVRETFGEAGDNDISLLYISTHGLYTANRPNLSASLLLSDGNVEARLTAQALANVLTAVRGTKVLVLDACHSGAFIGKGLSDFAQANPFAWENFYVLCSAGGSEESWYWRAEGADALHGAGYFTSILSGALNPVPSIPSDRDGDGKVSLKELKTYLLAHYAASTPQIYPENSDFVFYMPKDGAEQTADVLSDIRFEQTVFSGNVAEIGFTFRLNRPAEVSYQLIYDQRGGWDFSQAPMIADGGEGTLLPEGTYRRRITLALADEEQDVSGYLMLQIFSREGERMVLHESRLLRVFPVQGDVALDVRTEPSFIPGRGDELTVRVGHDVPCALTVSVLNAQGKTVRYLAVETPSRPQRLVPEGTTLYWDGRLEDGTSAAPGRYMVCVRTTVGGTDYTVYSPYFTLSEEITSG